MARIGAFSEAILPVLHYARACRGERLGPDQGLHDAGVIVAPPKEEAGLGVMERHAPLHVATDPRGPSIGVLIR
jgi:hypothetical protein